MHEYSENKTIKNPTRDGEHKRSLDKTSEIKNEHKNVFMNVDSDQMYATDPLFPSASVEEIKIKDEDLASHDISSLTQEVTIFNNETCKNEWGSNVEEQQLLYINNCQLLQEILQEAKVSVERAQDLATKLFQDDQLSTYSQFDEHFKQVSSAIDQAVISTTLGISALDTILSIREEESRLLGEDYDTQFSDDDPDYTLRSNNKREKIDNGEGDQKLKCNDCTYTARKESTLKKHRREKHELEKYKCRDCTFSSSKPLSMKRHMKNIHNVEDIFYCFERENIQVKHYVCTKCSYTDTNYEDLQDHILDQHNRYKIKEVEFAANTEGKDTLEQYKCTKCAYATTNKVYYNDHINSEMKYRKCPWCDVHTTLKKKSMAVHLKRNHGLWDKKIKCFQCPECDEKFGTLRNFLPHMAATHKIGPMFHCTKCDTSWKSWKELKYHTEEHNDYSFPCPDCPLVAKSKFRLHKHRRNVHTQGLMCDGCGCVLASTTQLSVHKPKCEKARKNGSFVKSAYSVPGQKKHRTIDLTEKKCEHCNFTTISTIGLKKHLKVEHKDNGVLFKQYISKHREKFFQCDECDYLATSPCWLRAHKKNKHTAQIFSCTHCDATFKHKTNLNQHCQQMHTKNPEMFRCTEPGCEYQCRKPSLVKYHVEKVHLGIRWPCDHCDYIGPYKGDLYRHMKKVHNIFPEGCMVKCNFCDFTSKKSSTLTAHKKKVHNVEC